ncbi:ATP-binding protein [Candidatus Woesearchaeota archaeon]|nr:ATP-binding protein [Candidatus Woesearchaeota archaeon]
MTHPIIRIPMWQMVPIYMQRAILDSVVAAVTEEDPLALDAIVREIGAYSDKSLCERELTHTIEAQFPGDEVLRELIQNSLDEIDEGGEIVIDYNLEGEVDFESIYSATVRDNGGGMSIQQVIHHLSVVGSSSKSDNGATIGCHGQGFLAALGRSKSVIVESDGWRTRYIGSNGERMVEFQKTDPDAGGTTITLEDFKLGYGTMENSLWTYAGYVDPRIAKIIVNGEQINSRDEFDFKMVEVIKDGEKEYEIEVFMGAGREIGVTGHCNYTQRGLYISSNWFGEEYPAILIDLPTEIILTRGRNEIPYFVRQHVLKNKNRYRRIYINHLLSNLENLNANQLYWLNEVLGFKKAHQFAKVMVGLAALYPVGRLLVYLAEQSQNINPTISEVVGYALVGLGVLAGVAGIGTVGYTTINTIKRIISRESFNDAGESIASGWRDFLHKCSILLTSIAPQYLISRRKIIPAHIKKRDKTIEEKVSLSQIRKANRRGKLYVGEVGESEGIYLSEEYKCFVRGLDAGKKGFSIRNLLTSVTVPYQFPVPRSLVRLASELGYSKERMALQEIGCYLSSLIAQANGLQDVGVLTGVSNRDVAAWTIRLPYCAPAYVVFNTRNELIKELMMRTGNNKSLTPGEVSSLVALVTHEYAHHPKKGFFADQSHTSEFFEVNDAVKTNFYSYVTREKIDFVAAANAIIARYIHP